MPNDQLVLDGAKQFEKPEALATPMDLLRIAMSQNADLDKLQKLMELQERWEANEARKAFVSAMNAFKKAPPIITKNKEVKFGNTAYKHATLDHVCDQITKALSDHGISHRWRVDQTPTEIAVICVLTHELGHSEETRLVGAADNSGSKNPIQAVGSTVTYLQRYTLLAATGLAVANTDLDGMPVTNGEVAEQIEWLKNARNIEELRKLYTQAKEKFADVPMALKAIVAAKDARKKELE
jgi:hypothetical protein